MLLDIIILFVHVSALRPSNVSSCTSTHSLHIDFFTIIVFHATGKWKTWKHGEWRRKKWRKEGRKGQRNPFEIELLAISSGNSLSPSRRNGLKRNPVRSHRNKRNRLEWIVICIFSWFEPKPIDAWRLQKKRTRRIHVSRDLDTFALTSGLRGRNRSSHLVWSPPKTKDYYVFLQWVTALL